MVAARNIRLLLLRCNTLTYPQFLVALLFGFCLTNRVYTRSPSALLYSSLRSLYTYTLQLAFLPFSYPLGYYVKLFPVCQ